MGRYVVIGGTMGIGKEVTSQLIRDDNQVLVLSRNSSDVYEEGIQHKVWDATEGDFPEIEWDSVDGLVYCPGTINLKPFGRLKQSDFELDWKINVMGAVHAIQALIPRLKKSDNPSVVLYSTVAVTQGMPYHSSVASAKGAIEGLCRSLAAEFSPSIRFNCVAPSITDTPLAERLLSNEDRRKASAERHPLKRVGSVEDIANMTLFLLGESSKWITGQVLHVDGGLSSIGS